VVNTAKETLQIMHWEHKTDALLALSPGIMPAEVLATLPAGSTVDTIRRDPDQMLALVSLAHSMTKAMSSSSLKVCTTGLFKRMVADAGESGEYTTPKDHQRWMSMQVPFHTGEGFLTFEGLNGRSAPVMSKFSRLCQTAKTNNNKPSKAERKSPAAKAKKTTIKKVAPKKLRAGK
jgi:hypothetical protein